MNTIKCLHGEVVWADKSFEITREEFLQHNWKKECYDVYSCKCGVSVNIYVPFAVDNNNLDQIKEILIYDSANDLKDHMPKCKYTPEEHLVMDIIE